MVKYKFYNIIKKKFNVNNCADFDILYFNIAVFSAGGRGVITRKTLRKLMLSNPKV